MRIFRAEPTEAFHEKLVVWKSAGELRALDLGGYESRNASVLRLIDAADTAHALPDFGPALVHTGDQPLNRGDSSWRSLAFSSAPGYLDEPVPDFLFDAWIETGIGDYEETCASLARAAARPAELPLVGWIGNCDTHPSRRRLQELAAPHGALFEVQHVSWVPAAPGARMSTADGNYLDLESQVRRWAVLLDVEGRGWSARTKLLLASGRPVLVQDRPWREWYWSALAPWEHFIPVAADLSDLVERARWAVEHPAEAAAIGAAGRTAIRTHASRDRALERWAEILPADPAATGRGYAPAAARSLLDPVLASLTPAVEVAA